MWGVGRGANFPTPHSPLPTPHAPPSTNKLMNSNTFIHGLSRVLNCPKVHVAVTGLVTTWFVIRYVTADLPPTQRASLWVAFIGAVAVQLREIINAWTEEDVAAVAGKGGDLNVGSGEVWVGSEASNAHDRSPDSQPPTPHTTPPTSPTRSSDMPARTKFPLVLIAFTLIALFATGCQTPPELATYREGLHQVDGPLYRAHLLLLDDAVKANLPHGCRSAGREAGGRGGRGAVSAVQGDTGRGHYADNQSLSCHLIGLAHMDVALTACQAAKIAAALRRGSMDAIRIADAIDPAGRTHFYIEVSDMGQFANDWNQLKTLIRQKDDALDRQAAADRRFAEAGCRGRTAAT